MDSKFWNKGATSYGIKVSPTEMHQAWLAWDVKSGYVGLAIELARIRPELDHAGAGHRLADRMCQKARMAGIIEPVASGRRGWRFIPGNNKIGE